MIRLHFWSAQDVALSFSILKGAETWHLPIPQVAFFTGFLAYGQISCLSYIFKVSAWPPFKN
jgi:hypothetical protein